QAILGQRRLVFAVFAVVVGAVLYRLIIFAALQVGLNPNDMKAITAILVVIALLLPRWPGARGNPLVGRFGRTPTTAVAANERAVAGTGTAVDADPESADAAATGAKET
ncbi:MAG: ABC transporter permease, partial [Dietzia cercidiphylli]